MPSVSMILLRSLLSPSRFTTLLSLKTANLPEIFGLFVYSRFSSNSHLGPWLTVPPSPLTHEHSYVLEVNPQSCLRPVGAHGCLGLQVVGAPQLGQGRPSQPAPVSLPQPGAGCQGQLDSPSPRPQAPPEARPKAHGSGSAAHLGRGAAALAEAK